MSSVLLSPAEKAFFSTMMQYKLDKPVMGTPVKIPGEEKQISSTGFERLKKQWIRI